MSELQSLLRLQSWLSPAFPIGAFSYSNGLEAAIASDQITDQGDLREWLEVLITSGTGWNDAVLLAQSWQASDAQEIAELAEAMSFSKERHLETLATGTAFLEAASAWGKLKNMPNPCPLPVAVGAVASLHKIDLEQTLSAYLHAYISNQIQAALRLMKLGQQGGLELLARFEASILEVAKRAAKSTLDDLGSNSFMADIASMRHETQPSRIFRS